MTKLTICNICYVAGNGVCVNCNHTPPTLNGFKYGDICRQDVEEILTALKYGNMVCYNSDNGKFYEKIMYTHPAVYMDDEWEVIG